MQDADKTHLGRVLVVDDDEQIGRACARVLGGEGWHVIVADNGRSAIGEIEASAVPFDCVLSDVKMPEFDGFQLVAALHKRDDDIPVLLMTGDPDLDGAMRAINTGAVSYLTKPFDHEALASSVARAARRHGVARMRRRSESYARALYADPDIERRFSHALECSWMAYQPIVDVRAKKVYAYEALLRTDEDSMKRTDIFIATAERLDRVHALGRKVRALVARDAEHAPHDVQLFVNVHGLDLGDEDLFAPDTPFARMSKRVVLEITERTGLDPAAGPARAAMLRQLGYRVAVDDLGAGYAALGALATLEPEIVKLDISLVRDLHRHATKRRVVGAIATLCRELGGRVVAEGVETEAERNACIEAGIDLMQGYLFARPARGFVTPEM